MPAMNRTSLLRKLEDLHNELAHIRLFPYHYPSHVDRFTRRVAVVDQIRQLLAVLVDTQERQA